MFALYNGMSKGTTSLDLGLCNLYVHVSDNLRYGFQIFEFLFGRTVNSAITDRAIYIRLAYGISFYLKNIFCFDVLFCVMFVWIQLFQFSPPCFYRKRQIQTFKNDPTGYFY